MLPQTPFQQMLLPRLEKARQRIAGQVWSIQPQTLRVWKTPATKAHRSIEEISDSEFQEVTQLPYYWGNMFDQCWWKVQIPKQDDPEKKRYLFWNDQGEANVYLDGVPHYGVDPRPQICTAAKEHYRSCHRVHVCTHWHLDRA